MANFSWDDGVQGVFATPFTPRVAETFVGWGQTVPTLDGGAFLAYQYRVLDAVANVQGARVIAFEWEVAPEGLATVVLNSWRFARQVTVQFINPLDFTTVDTITGIVPVHTPPEVESIGGRCVRLKVIVQEARV